jgi:all-trans-retinol dehydrogenase (NAD+)
MKQRFVGKTVVITGGASGIGRLVSLDLARRGARVIAWDISPAALDALGAEAKAAGSEIATMLVDVSDRKAVYAAAAEILDERGIVDILVNNAGVVSGKKLLDTQDEKIEKTFQVNTLAHFWTTKAFLPAMLAKDSGHIVTLSSAAGLIGVCGLADYSASKFAAFGFNESLRMELRKIKSSIRTTIVCPFYVNTGLFEGVKTRLPHLLPILEPEYVAGRIVKALRKGRQRVITPPLVLLALMLRVFPVGALDTVSDICGISSTMDEFRGRSSAVE